MWKQADCAQLPQHRDDQPLVAAALAYPLVCLYLVFADGGQLASGILAHIARLISGDLGDFVISMQGNLLMEDNTLEELFDNTKIVLARVIQYSVKLYHTKTEFGARDYILRVHGVLWKLLSQSCASICSSRYTVSEKPQGATIFPRSMSVCFTIYQGRFTAYSIVDRVG